MLTKKEQRLVARYYVMTRLCRVFLVLCPLMLVEFGILVFINDAFIHAGGMNYIGIAAILGIFLLDIAGLCVFYLVPRFGMEKSPWTKIRVKAGRRGKRGTYKDEEEPSISYALDRMEEYAVESSSMTGEAEFVAKACKVKVPPRFILTAVPCLLCTAIMLAAFLPYYSAQHDANEQSRAAASVTYDEVVRGLSTTCSSVSGSDPQDEYRPEGYDVFGYLYDRDADDEIYVAVGIGADGVIEDIAYSIAVDESGDRAAVLERAKREYARLHEGVATIEAPFEYEGMLEPEALPDDFCEQFLAAPPDERVEATVYSRYARQEAGDNRANISVTYFDTGYGDDADWQIRVMVD